MFYFFLFCAASAVLGIYNQPRFGALRLASRWGGSIETDRFTAQFDQAELFLNALLRAPLLLSNPSTQLSFKQTNSQLHTLPSFIKDQN